MTKMLKTLAALAILAWIPGSAWTLQDIVQDQKDIAEDQSKVNQDQQKLLKDEKDPRAGRRELEEDRRKLRRDQEDLEKDLRELAQDQAEAKKKAIHISITSPPDGSATNKTAIDVQVAFSTQGTIHEIQLLVNGTVAATFPVPGGTKTGSHTFPSVDLSASANTGTPALLVARAFPKKNAPNTFTDSAPVHVIVDTLPPAISALSPADGSRTNNPRPTLSAQVTDTGGSGVDPASIQLKLDGSLVVAMVTVIDLNTAAVSFTPGANLAPGPHTFTVDAKDKAGNTAPTASSTFTEALTPPLAVITAPANGSFTNNPTPTVTGTVTDRSGAGIDPASIVLRLDGAAVAATLTPGSPTFGVSFTPGTPLAQGPHTVTLDAKDLAGNVALTATSSFTVDLTPPVLSILAPVSGSFTNNPKPPLSAQATDTGGSGVDPASIVLRLDGGIVVATVTVTGLNPDSITFTPASPLSEGTHTYTLDARDRAGNAAQTATASFLVDLTPPSITINAPVSGSSGDNPKPPLSATLTDLGSGIDPLGVVVTLDGIGVTPTVSFSNPNAASVTFTPSVALGLGTHSYAVSAKDRAGNVAAPVSSSFTVTNTPLTLTASSIPNGSFVDTTKPTFTATITNPENSGINPATLIVRLDGTVVPATVTPLNANSVTVSFSPATPLAPGPHLITIDGQTSGGNPFATVSDSFGVDLTPPVISNVSPANGALITNSQPTISASVTDAGGSGVDPNGVTLLVNGISVPVTVTLSDANTASVSFKPTAPLSDGSQAITLNALDRAGNAATPVSSAFLIDTLPPSITITSPLDGSTTAASTVSLAAVISDSGSGVDVTSIQVVYNGNDVTASVTISPSAPLASGAPSVVTLSGSLAVSQAVNTVQVSAKDLAGNAAPTATASFFVPSGTLLPPAPPFIVDVDKLSAVPVVVEDIPPAPGVDAQTWTSRTIKVQVTLSFQGTPQQGVSIVPTLTSGQGTFYFTSDFPQVSDANGTAGFLFVCPRFPQQVQVTVAAEVLNPGRVAQFTFNALQVVPDLILVGDFPGSGCYASIPGPTGIGMATIILDELDDLGNPVTDPTLQKLTIFSRVTNAKSSGIANVPLLMNSNATGVVHLRATYPEFEDNQGNLVAVTDSFDIDGFLAQMPQHNVMVQSGNGQILFPGRALDQPIVIQNLVLPDSNNPVQFVSVSILQNVTQRGPDFPGIVEPIDGTLIASQSDPGKKSFAAIVTNPNGTLSFRYTADQTSVTGVILVIGGGTMPSMGATPALTPGDTVVVREPEIHVVLDNGPSGNQGQLEALPLSPIDTILAGGLPSSGSYHMEVKVPRSGVGTDTPTINAMTLQPDLNALPTDSDFPPVSQDIGLQLQGQDTFVSKSLLISPDRTFLNATPAPSFNVLFAGTRLQLTMLLGMTQQQVQPPPYLTPQYTPGIPEKGQFSNGLVNNRINVIEPDPAANPKLPPTKISIDLGVKPPPALNGKNPVQILGQTDPASGTPIGIFIVDGKTQTDPFTVNATPAPKSIIYQLDPTKIVNNSVDRVLKFQLLNSTAANDQVTVTVPIRLSHLVGTLNIGFYYLQTDATDLFTNPPKFPQVGEVDRHMKFVNLIWAQNGIVFKEVKRAPVPNMAPIPGFVTIPGDTLAWVDGSLDTFAKALMTNEAATKASLFVLFNNSINVKDPVTGIKGELLGFVPNVAPMAALGAALNNFKPNFALLEKKTLTVGTGVPMIDDGALAHEMGHCLGLFDGAAGAGTDNLMISGPRLSSVLQGPGFPTVAGAQDQITRSIQLTNFLK